MAIYTTFIYHLLYLVRLGLDITAFFLIVSAVLMVRDVAWLRTFQQAGGPLVDMYLTQIDRWWRQLGKQPLAPCGKLLVGLLFLEGLRLIVTLLASALLPAMS